MALRVVAIVALDKTKTMLVSGKTTKLKIKKAKPTRTYTYEDTKK